MVDSRDAVEEIRGRINILDVISEYVSLKRAGKSFKGLCPFHAEKTPSFNVSEEFQSWHCFGCDEHGDVFSFLMKIENLTFAEALERLAKKTGVELQRSKDRQTSRRELLSRINGLAAAYYAALLKRNPAALEYLVGRGLAEETIEEFRLGYAAPGWDGLATYLAGKKVSEGDAALAGLLIKGDRGYYDRFRHRVVFPILDIQERVIGFGGRAIGDDQPKYLNSPETPLFSKTRALYGLNLARKKIAAEDAAVVVEGYMDVIAAHQAGFGHCVATLGTALTTEHTNILSRYTKRIVLAYDADGAGMKAALRSAAMFLEAEFDVRIARLPKGEDPDSMLRRGATAEFASALSDAQPIVDYRLGLLRESHDLSTPAGKASMLREIARILAEIPSTLQREEYIRSLAVGRFHPSWESGRIGEVDIRREIEQILRRRGAGPHRAPRVEEDRKQPESEPEARIGSAERSILRALIHGSEYTAVLADSVSPEDFSTESGREAASALMGMIEEQGAVSVPELLAAVGGGAGKIISELAVDDEGPPLTEEWLRGCAEFVKKARLKRLRTQDVMQPFIREGIIEAGDSPEQTRERLRAYLKESGKLSEEGAREGNKDSDS